jgi:carboxypeptidase Taq
MTKKLQNARQYFFEKMKLMQALGEAQSLLSWDRETYMPSGAAANRGQTMSTIAGFSHQLFTEPKFVEAVELLNDQQKELDPLEARTITLLHRELRKSLKLTQEFVEETNQIVNSAYHSWLEAKQKDEFKIFQPHLEKVIENRRQYAEFLDPSKDAYDVSLDDYEEGLTTEFLNPIFATLRKGLKELLPQVLAIQKEVKNPLNEASLDEQKLRSFLKEMIATIGFDWNRGAMGAVEHPFQISISFNDVRLNTKFADKESSFTIMGMIHELGHGIYEQNIDPKYSAVYLDHGVSLGIHESQSRFLENIIGRSSAFWTYFLPKLQSHFDQLKSVQLSEIVSALNQVEPSLIRTEADEVTYNLHILLRFEIEQMLLRGEATAAQLPEIWRAKMKELVGIEPKTDKEGVLQDVHWAWGNLGYFPTYTLGNLNAAQLFAKFGEAHPQWRDEVSKGNFTCYTSWFKEHIWQHGSFFKPEELMQKATGEETNAKYFLEYLKKKYL